jgi:Zn-dependent protease with chaperone function
MSNINTSSIDPTFPVAGQDNSSQGFRDNYSAIISSFATAKDEITELQTKSIFKTALSDTTLSNDMQGAEITNATLKNPGYTALLAASNTITVSNASYHKIAVSTNTTITVTSTTWPSSGIYSKIIVEVAPSTANTTTVQFAVSGVGYTLLADASATGGVFTSTSTNSTLWELSSADDGARVFLRKLGGPFTPV